MGDPGASFSKYPKGGTIPKGGLTSSDLRSLSYGGDNFGENWAPWTRTQLGADTPGECTGLGGPAPPPAYAGKQGGCSAGYGRVTLHNASHMTYEYVLNKNGSVWDSWTVVQPTHGQFPATL